MTRSLLRRSRRLRLESLEARAVPATFTVTDTLDDDNFGSFRWAINQVNTDTDPTSAIDFHIAESGVQTIRLSSYLPTITHPVTINGYCEPGASENTLANGDNAVLTVVLDGTGLGAGLGGLVIAGGNSTVEGLVVSNFPSSGIRLDSDWNVVRGNFIGTDVNGTTALANGASGVFLQSDNNTVGGTTSGARNVIFDGVRLDGSSTYGNKVQGNYIGTDYTGKSYVRTPSGNFTFDSGILIDGGAHDNHIGGTGTGEGNVIAFQSSAVVLESDTTGNSVRGNSIFSTDRASIGLLGAANNGATAPVITTVTCPTFQNACRLNC